MMNKKMLFTAVFPIFLLFALFFIFTSYGPIGVFKTDLPQVEKIFIERFELEPGIIYIHIVNDGPEQVTISQITVNEMFWNFEMFEDNIFKPLERGVLKLNYPWVEGDPYRIVIFASDGVTFDGEIEVATSTPKFNWIYFKSFVMLGLYVGVIPILVGLLWFPFLRRLNRRWYYFLLSLTIGLLAFLGFDTLAEAFGLIGEMPQSYNGVGILVLGFFLAILTLSAISHKIKSFGAEKNEHHKSLTWGYFIAIGIGLHNLGEGLAIGSAYSIGEIALGSALVVGFMIHNVTEGIAIVAPLTKNYERIKHLIIHLIAMGGIAGGPTIIGTLIGGFSYSTALSVFFLAIGAGAIFDVAFDILYSMAKEKGQSLFTITNVLGFFAGLLVIYLTGFLVLG
ncbi:ZIP family metal transporter [Candidatus Pacearchaeota archaeon]|nr:ZIP family metal transporter [Candidatus Pacearchaeota archaeon]